MKTISQMANRDTRLAYKRFLFNKMQIEVRPGVLVPYLEGVEKHPAQHEVHFGEGFDAKYLVIPGGRRGGKTILAAAEAIYTLGLPRTRTWIVAPNYELTDRVFEYVWDQVVRKQLYGPGSIAKKSKTKDQRYIETKNGSWIRGKSADSPDSLVGEQLDLLLMDEAARMKEEIWTENLEATLIDRHGKVFFTSTPRGYNWYHEYYERGRERSTRAKGWRCWTFKSTDNPYLDADWIRSKRDETPDLVYRQEYEASFEHFSGLVYKDFRDTLLPAGHLFDPEEVGIDSTWTHYLGIDVGTAHPTYGGWGAVAPRDQGPIKKGDLCIYQDYLEQMEDHQSHAEAINALTAYPIAATYGSPDIVKKETLKKGLKLSIQDVYRKAGIYVLPAARDVAAGIGVVAHYLRSALNTHSRDPGIWISKNCITTRRAFKRYVHHESQITSKLDAPDKPLKQKDDEMDGLRYLVATRPALRPGWHLREQQPMTEAERYGYQNSAFMRSPKSPRRNRMASVPRVAR